MRRGLSFQAEPGTYTLSRAECVDAAGNFVTLRATDFTAMHFQSSFRVANADWPAAASRPPRRSAVLAAGRDAAAGAEQAPGLTWRFMDRVANVTCVVGDVTGDGRFRYRGLGLLRRQHHHAEIVLHRRLCCTLSCLMRHPPHTRAVWTPSQYGTGGLCTAAPG
jgi:hypothetical protein